MFFGGCWLLKRILEQSSYTTAQFLLYARSTANATVDLLTVLQIAFSLLGIVTAIGLLLLREWARKATIFLSTVPVCVLLFALLVFFDATHATGRGGLVAAYGFLMYGVFLLILIPLSIWWYVLLTRDKVRAQFR